MEMEMEGLLDRKRDREIERDREIDRERESWVGIDGYR